MNTDNKPRWCKIYADRQAAMDAVRDFQDKLEVLTDEYNLCIQSEDSCCGLYYSVPYYDENKKVKYYEGV